MPALEALGLEGVEDLERLGAKLRVEQPRSRRSRACRCGSPARRRGSRGTWPRARPRGARARPHRSASSGAASRRAAAPAPPRRRLAQRRADDEHDQRDQREREERDHDRHRGDPPRGLRRGPAARRARAGARRGARADRARRRPDRDQPAEEDDQPADPDPHHQRRDDEVELRRRRVLQVAPGEDEQRDRAPVRAPSVRLPAFTIRFSDGASMFGWIALQTSRVTPPLMLTWLTGWPPIRLPTVPCAASWEA